MGTITDTYDPDTLVTKSVGVTGLNPVEYDYFSDGKLQFVTSGTRQTELTYQDGNLHTVTDPSGNQTTYQDYDAMGRLKTMIRTVSSVLKFDYDKNGNMTVLTTHTNPLDVNHGFLYNGVGLIKFYTPPISDRYTYLYDKDKRLQKIDFPSGKTIVYDYADPSDPLDKSRLQVIRTPEGDIDIDYYPCGEKIESMTKDAESISYTSFFMFR